MKINIREANSSSEITSFIKFGFSHYSDKEYWVPPIIQQRKKYFSSKNPMLAFGELQLILAYHKNKIVGRAAVFINQRENDLQGIKQARFGYVEFINKIQVSRELFKYIEDWTKARGMTNLVGPMNFAQFEPAGLLYEGFVDIGSLESIYNHSYYPKHLDSLGYKSHQEIQEMSITLSDQNRSSLEEAVEEAGKQFLTKNGLRVLPIIKKAGLESLITQAFLLFHSVYTKEKGYTKLTKEEIDFYRNKLKPFIKKDFLIFIGDEKGQLQAFGFAMPSYSKALKKANGKLFPFGLIQINKAKKQNDRANLYQIAVHPDWQNNGLESVILEKLLSRLRKNKIKHLTYFPKEAVIGNFHLLLEEYRPEVIKKRRIYHKELIVIT